MYVCVCFPNLLGLIAASSASMVPVTATLHANCGSAAIAATIGGGNISSANKLRTRHIPRVTCEKLDLADIRKRDVKAIVTAATIKVSS